MQALTTILGFFLEHKEIIIGIIVNIVTILKLTSWGKAKGRALDSVVDVIERIGSQEVKSAVAGTEAKMNAAVKDALRDSVAKADPMKTAAGPLAVIAREVLRGIIRGK